MPGDIIRLLTKTDFDFGPMSAGSFIQDIPLVQNIELDRWATGQLVVRVHSSLMVSDAEIRLTLKTVAPTDSAPGALFRGAAVACAGFPGTVVAPAIASGALLGRGGEMVSLFLTVVRISTGSCQFTISVDLVRREGADAPWLPSNASNLSLWLDDRSQTTSAGKYSEWDDASTTGIQFKPTDTSSAPLTGSAINGFASPNWTGKQLFTSQGTVKVSAIIAKGSYHGFAVINPATSVTAESDISTNPQIVCDADGRCWGLLINTSGIAAWQTPGATPSTSVATPTVPYVPGLPYLLEWSYDGTNLTFRLDAFAAVSVSAGNVFDLSAKIQLGHGWSGSDWYAGLLSTVVIFKHVLGATDALGVRDYLSSKYGVPR